MNDLVVRTVRVEHESGAWAEIRASRSNAVKQALLLNRYWRDVAPVLSPLILAWGGFTIEVLEREEAPAVLAEDGETELVPARTVYRAVEILPPPPAEDGESILKVFLADRVLANWFHLQAMVAAETYAETEGKAPGQPSADTPDGMPAEAIPATTKTTNRRAHASSSKHAAWTSA